MKRDNPYVKYTHGVCDVGRLIDWVEHDAKKAIEIGPECVKVFIDLMQEADGDWRGDVHPSQRARDETPFTPSLKVLKQWLRDNTPKRTRRAKKRPDRGFIYFVTFDHQRVKIGFAVNVGNRMKGLATGAPSKLVLLLSVQGTLRDEQLIHKRFGAHRLYGEWFDLCNEIKAFIEAEKTKQAEG
jgi:hypothetical protein